ncbi:phenolphthiocerol/phthiocerol polyketide synthase subunit C-like [Diadema antillarum]|uniref:phenolphthiocerol/phthiocerol polyketide synthase subunit C-like n=1 Tax=Diadema antillarum TaxID=105358 RepID=UPI003A88A5E8
MLRPMYSPPASSARFGGRGKVRRNRRGGRRSHGGRRCRVVGTGAGRFRVKSCGFESVNANGVASTMDSLNDPTMSADDKIAIVGIGCRFADGIDGVYKFWDMLAKGLDCTTPPPADRYDQSFFIIPGEKRPGKMYNKCGGYLRKNPEYFDRQFFKISPEEADHMDPQVRLLLEVVWETFQDAGIPAPSVRGSNTGVYMGVTASEYSILITIPEDNINLYTNSGTNSCMASNRISYEYDFHGPSLTVNTACSSSLYSILLACDGLRKGQCDMAVAGGVNITLLQITSVGFCQGDVVSPDGKSKTFDNSADGYARGEGVGAVVLKPLKRAIEDGDRIYAVIRGGALSNDGRTSGIARPSHDAQVALLEKAYDDAKVNPTDLTYLEAHGTGTKVGDRTEANAIGEALGTKRRSDQHPLYIGSIKTNFGHAEAAAGIAGVIKLALSLQHEQIPKQVHFKSGNENVDFVNLNLRVPTELTRWPEGAKKIVGCSSFGFGGANAHIVLEGFSSRKQQNSLINHRVTEKPSILFLSAATKGALTQCLQDWDTFFTEVIGDDRVLYTNALYTAGVRSTHLDHRMCIIVRSPSDARNQIKLKLQQDTKATSTVIEGQARDTNISVRRLVFVYSGMGAQWWGMARRLAINDPDFGDIIKNIDKMLSKLGAKWSLMQMLTTEEDQAKINQTDIAQPCLCAVQIGLTEYYRSRGITPDAIVGHSVGEVAAAYASGHLSLEDAVRLIYARGYQLRKTSGRGTMVAILHPVEEIEARLKSSKLESKINVAAINSPRQIVLSGDKEALASFTEDLKEEGVRCIGLKVSNAFHSYQQEDVRKSFLASAKYLNTTSGKGTSNVIPSVPILSTVTTTYLERSEVNSASYWWQNIRQLVRFMDAVKKLLQDGYNCFLEIGPHPVLSSAIRDTLRTPSNSNNQVVVTGSLQRPSNTNLLADDELSLLRSISRLHVEGYPIEHKRLFPDGPCEVVSLPSYPWQHVLCSGTTQKSRKLFSFPLQRHPLLGKRLHVSHLSGKTSPKIWSSKFSQMSVPWLRDHKLQGNVIVPAAAHIETMLEASREIYPNLDFVTLKDVKFERFIFAPKVDGSLEITLETGQQEANLTLRSFNPADRSWKLNSMATVDIPVGAPNSLQPLADVARYVRLTSEDIQAKFPHMIDQAEFYDVVWARGYHLGETFRCIETAYFSHDYNEALMYASVPEPIKSDSNRYNFHPALFDSIFQGFGVCQMFQEQEKARQENATPKVWFQVPHALQTIHVLGSAPLRMMFYIRIKELDGATCGDAVLADASTQRVFTRVDNMMFEKVNYESDERVQLWSRKWMPLSPDSDRGSTSATETAASGSIVMVTDKLGICPELMKHLDRERISIFDPCNSCDIQDDFSKILQVMTDSSDVILLSALDIQQFDNADVISTEKFLEAQRVVGINIIDMYRALVSSNMAKRPRVWIVTRGAQAVTDKDVVNPMMAPTSSLSLTLMHEDPEMRVITVDLPSIQEPGEAALWLFKYMKNEISTENHVALRHKQSFERGGSTGSTFDTYAHRVVIQPQSTFAAAKSSEWEIDLTKTLNQKRVVAEQNEGTFVSRQENVVNVKVSAFSVQQLQGDPYNCCYLFAGLVRNNSEQGICEVGTTVLGVRTGEKLSAIVAAEASELVPIPDNLTPATAVSIVKDYFPLFVALNGALRSNEKSKVIVCLSSEEDHAGMIATEFALEKKDATVYVHMVCESGITKASGLLGQERVVSVTTDNIDAQINNKSADVLVLVGELPDEKRLTKLFQKVRPLGSVVQVRGKPFHEVRIKDMPPNLFSVTIDSSLGQLTGMVDSISSLLHLFDAHENYHIHMPPASSALPISECAKASASLENVTIYIDEDKIPVSLNFERSTFSANPQASYLVTGASKGFGLSVVEWLASSGARHIFIISRNVPGAETSQRLDLLRDRGINITHIAADMSSYGDVERALLAIQQDGDHALEGVFHSATLYSDTYLQSLTQEIWNMVMMPKAYGALLLHQLTTKLNFPIKHFVMVSSLAEMIGNRGQGNYCAANTFLSSLCTMRRNCGLPATSLLPGVINSQGFAAREGLVDHWKKLGLESLSPSEILGALGCILSTDYTVVGVSGILDRLEYAKGFHVMISHHFSDPSGTFSVLKSLFPPEIMSLESERDIRKQIKRAAPAEGKSLIMQSLSAFFSERLGYSGDVSQDATLMSLGLDSHLSTDLSNDIHDQFSVTLTAMSLLNDTLTLRNLTEVIHSRIVSEGLEGEEATAIVTTEGIVDALWLDVNEKLDSPSAQLICFPSVAGGPTMFLPWKKKLASQNIQMITIQLPGWERREQEKPLQSLQDIVTKIAEALMPTLIRGHFAFFGHSVGALIAFELAHHLRENYNISPAHLFLSAWYPPTMAYPRPDDLKENELLYRKMQQIINNHADSPKVPTSNGHSFQFSLFEPSTMNNVNLRTSLIPSIKAAVFICKKYRYAHKDKLLGNLTVFGGKDDSFIRPSVLDDWKKEVSPRANFVKVTFPGQHMYILSASKHVLKCVMRELTGIRLSDDNPENAMKGSGCYFWQR